MRGAVRDLHGGAALDPNWFAVALQCAGEVPFRCTVAPDGDSVAIRLYGELDMATAPEVDAAFADVAEDRLPVTLDLRGLTFMDSRGVRMLVSFNEQARARGFPLTVACGESVEQLLKLTGLNRHLTVVQLPGE